MQKTLWLLTLSLLSVPVCFASPANAVIPQLIGPLTALLSIIPQILAFVGVAIVTSLVFARDSTKMVFYKVRDFFTVRRTILSVVSLVVLVGLAVFTFQLVERGIDHSKPTVDIGTQQQKESKMRAGSSWYTFRGDANRTGNVDGLPGPENGTLSWPFSPKNRKMVQFFSSPAVVGNRLYIGTALGGFFSASGVTYCIDTDTKEIVWQHESDIPIASSPAVVAGRVYIGEGFHEDSGCQLRCLDAQTGDPIWSFTTASHVESTPFITKGRLYFTAGADGIYCIDALAGEEIWHFPAVHADMSPLVKDGKVFFGTGYGDYKVYAVDADNGKEIWSKSMPYSVWGNPSSHQNLVYFGLSTGNFAESGPNPKGKVVAFNIENGDIAWEHKAGDGVLTAIVVHDDYVTFGSRDGHVYTLKATNGDIHREKDLGSPVLSSPAVTKDAMYVATEDGMIYSLNIANGDVLWEYNARTIKAGLKFISSPTIANEKLYIGSSLSYILCVGGDKVDQTIEDR